MSNGQELIQEFMKSDSYRNRWRNILQDVKTSTFEYVVTGPPPESESEAVADGKMLDRFLEKILRAGYGVDEITITIRKR